MSQYFDRLLNYYNFKSLERNLVVCSNCKTIRRVRSNNSLSPSQNIKFLSCNHKICTYCLQKINKQINIADNNVHSLREKAIICNICKSSSKILY